MRLYEFVDNLGCIEWILKSDLNELCIVFLIIDI